MNDVYLALAVTVNGMQRSVRVDSRMALVDLLRDELGLTGTHIGCRTGNCGACTVILSGRTIKSCCIFAADVQGEAITTIEGLSAEPGTLHPMQEAFARCHGLQCGFCTPGMILSAVQLVAACPNPTPEDVRRGISGNLCRCTGYQFIVRAVLEGARALRDAHGVRQDETLSG